MIEKHRFQNYKDQYDKDQEKGRIFTIRLNQEEYEALLQAKKVLQQPKDSTAIKMLAEIGANVLHDSLTGNIIKTIFDNKRRNDRIGIVEVE